MTKIDIESFINLLESSYLDTTELSDILWLAKYMKTDKRYYIPKEKVKESPDYDEIDKKDTTPQEEMENPVSNEKQIETIEERNDDSVALSVSNKKQETNKAINISHKGYFDDSNQISKYLIDFKDKTSSKRKKLFDEITTINYKANTGILNPFFKAKKQKLYTLYLFIDYSSSMNVWNEMINEYTKLLSSGIFKSVKHVYFNSNNSKTLFYKDKKLNTLFSPKEITNFHNDKLIFVLTDMLSNGWKNGDTLNIVAKLYKSIPVYIVQMLPYRLWRTTALKKASITTFNSIQYYPIGDSYNSEIDHLLKSLHTNNQKNLKLPIVSFDLAYLKVIGKTLKAKEDNKIDGAIFNLENTQNDLSIAETKVLTGQEKVEYFFANASPKAQELAKCLSAVQFNLPIMRMIQEKVLKESSNIYIAEVINSGLVNNHDNILEFNDDVCDVLYKLLGRERALEIAYKNSDYIQENLGANFGFKAYLSGQVSLENTELSETDKKFATISCRILKSMGGEYAKLAESIKNTAKTTLIKTISPLQPSIEQPVANQNGFFSRDNITNKIWDVLSKGDHIFLHGMRKIGKTSILMHIANNPKSNYAVMYLNLHSISSPDEFFTRVYNALIDLAKYNKPVLFLIDEFSQLIDRSQDDNQHNAVALLEKLRSLRLHNNEHKIQFIFVGDKEFNHSQMNDLFFIEVPPLSDEEANLFLNKLLSYHKLNIDNSIKKYILDEIFLFNPFYIKVIVDNLLEVTNHKNIDKNTVDKIIDQIIKEDTLSFALWKHDLLQSVATSQKSNLISILNYISVRGKYSYGKDIGLKGKTDQLRDILEILSKQYVLLEYYADYVFQDILLEKWWKNNIDNLEQYISSLVVMDLKNQGWHNNNILQEYTISNHKYADIVLIDNGQPSVVIEIKSQIKDIDVLASKVISYAKELQVEFAYFTEGNKIYKCDINKRTSQEVSQYISPSELHLRITTAPNKNINSLSQRRVGEEKYMILWVDDRPDNNKYERKIFENEGIVFDLALSTNEALEYLKDNKYLAIISDMGRKEGPQEGYILLEKLRKFDIDLPLFFYAGSNLEEHKKMALERGAQGSTNNRYELYKMIMNIIQKNEDSIIKENDRTKNQTSDITFDCKECKTGYSLNCKELQWEQVGGSERNMGAEIEYEAKFHETCHECNNEMYITFNCSEYPIGVENYRDVFSNGIDNLQGNCCLEFNMLDEEDTGNYDEFTVNTDISYATLEEKIEVLETFINNLIPYSELEFTYDSEDFSNEKNIPFEQFLISREFDSHYLDDLIDEIQEDINEVQFALDYNSSDNLGNNISNNSLLLKKQYTVEYDDAPNAYGVDIDCNVYEEDNKQILYIYPSSKIEFDEDILDVEEEIVDIDIDIDKAEAEMKEWFFKNYEDPANFLPYTVYGSPYKFDEILYKEFGDKYPDYYIQKAIENLENEHGDISWTKRPKEDRDLEIIKSIKKYPVYELSHFFIISLQMHGVNSGIIDRLRTLNKRCDFLYELYKILDEATRGPDQKNRQNIINDFCKKVDFEFNFINDYMVVRKIFDNCDKYNEVHNIESDEEEHFNIDKVDGDFKGWNGESIIKLTNGEFWKQSEYYYEYLYAFMPNVTLIHSPTGYKMKVDGIDKEVSVEKLNNAIQSKINGSFNGWEGNTVVELSNGDKWKQSMFKYSYSYAYSPNIIIYHSNNGFKMKVDGNNETVDVERVI